MKRIFIAILMVLTMTLKVKASEELIPYELSQEDADLVLRVGAREANVHDVEAMANVMQVVLNRVDDPRFPDNVHDVIYAKKQFACCKSLDKADITEEATDALVAVMCGEYRESEALYFESLPGKVWSKCHMYLFSNGGHDFYK